MSERHWYTESIVPGVRLGYEAQRVLAHEHTGQQELTLIENGLFGQVLFLDNTTQLTSADEFMYHEMLGHVPLLAHGAAADVLIIGGGDCGLAQEVLKHAAVRRLTQIEIDSSVVEFARQHLGAINAGAFADARFDLRIGDGAAFVASTEQRFDVVLVDSTDPVGPAKVLFTTEFYSAVRRCLKPGGVLALQAGVPFLQRCEFSSAMSNLAAAFPIASCYLVAVPTYFGGHMALGWASETLAPESVTTETLIERYREAGLRTRYYTPQVHTAAFALPGYIGDLLPRRAAAGSAS